MTNSDRNKPEPRIRDRHANPPRFPWLLPTIVVVAVIVVVAAIVVGLTLHIRWF